MVILKSDLLATDTSIYMLEEHTGPCHMAPARRDILSGKTSDCVTSLSFLTSHQPPPPPHCVPQKCLEARPG